MVIMGKVLEFGNILRNNLQKKTHSLARPNPADSRELHHLIVSYLYIFRALLYMLSDHFGIYNPQLD